MKRRRRRAQPREVTREETRVFEIQVSALLAHYFVITPRRLPEDARTRHELVNFIHECRSQLQHVGVFAEPPDPYDGR